MLSLLNSRDRKARLARDGGWKGILRRELRTLRVRTCWVADLAFIVDDLEAELPVIPPPEGVRIERYTGEDWDLFRELAGPRDRRLYAARIAAGRVLLVAWRGNEPLGVTWISDRAEMALDGLRLELPPGWGYTYRLLVRRDARGAGLGSALINARLHHARVLGFRRLCRATRVTNVASLRCTAKARSSLTPMGHLRYVYAVGFRWVRWTQRPANGDLS